MAAHRSKPGPKFGPTERQQVLAKVAQMDRMGLCQWEIARQVGVSQVCVSQYLQELRDRYEKQANTDVGRMTDMMIQRYQVIFEEAWEEYHRSKLDGVEKAQEYGRPYRPKDPKTGKLMGRATKKLALVGETVTTTGRLGDPKYMDVMIECMDKVAKLLAMYPEKVTKVQGVLATIDWDRLGCGVQQGVQDEVEALVAMPLLAAPKCEERDEPAAVPADEG